MFLYLRHDGAVLDYETKQPIPDGAWMKGVCWLTGKTRRAGPYEVCEASVQANGWRGRCRVKTAALDPGAGCNLQGMKRIGS